MELNSGGFKIRNQAGVHFITFAVVNWVDVFSRQVYRDILLESLKYCQINRGLNVHAWVVMTNHVHLIVSSSENDLSDILRDFKKFTSAHILKTIKDSSVESRKDWMLNLFREAGKWNARNGGFQFWQQDNHPIELYSGKFIWQKINYIHENPVCAGMVAKPEHYLYSSAKDYLEMKSCGLLEVAFL